MADITTAIVSGTFALAGSLGSVWLKDYLEQRRQARLPPVNTAPSRPSAPAAPRPVPTQALPRAASRLRPLMIALFGFGVGAVSSFVRPMFPPPTHPEAIASLVVLGLAVLSFVAYHSRLAPDRSVALFELETLSLWAAFACGWSIVHGGVWSDFVVSTIGAWLVSAVAGLLLVPIVRNLRTTQQA
jgi:hypothetical protein